MQKAVLFYAMHVNRNIYANICAYSGICALSASFRNIRISRNCMAIPNLKWCQNIVTNAIHMIFWFSWNFVMKQKRK